MQMSKGAAASGVNNVVRLVAGPLAPLVERVWPGSRAADYLAAPDGRRQVWHACLVMPAFEQGTAEEVRRDFETRRGVDLLAQAYGVRLPNLPRALAKLGPVGCAPETYPALVRVLQEGGPGAKLVRHASGLSEERVLALAALPAEQRHAGLPKRLDPRRIAELSWHLARFEAITGKPAPRIKWRHDEIRPEEQLVLEAAQLLDGPLAPYPSAGHMRALTSSRELRQAGRAFGNCLVGWAQSSALDIVRGSVAIYSWSGEERALVRLHRIPLFGWEVTEVAGVKNREVSDKTRSEIASWFADKPDVLPWSVQLSERRE